MGEYVYFHWADYTIFIAILVLFTLIGVVVSWLDRKKTSVKYFLTGDGQSHWMMVALSMQASFLSAIFMLSVPGEIYNYGTAYIYVCIAKMISMPVATRFYLPIFHRLNLISVYEYLEKRFNKIIRLMASLVFCFQMILYLSIVLYAPALALSQATGFTILWAILFCGGVCTIYTCLGGMKATIWNDTIQMLIIYLGLIVVIVKGVIEVGGVSEVLKRNQDGGRIIFNEFRFDPTLRTTFWTQVIGGFVIFLTSYTSNQAIIQKVIASKTLTSANRSLYFCMVSSTVMSALVTLFGMMVYAFYYDCDPIKSGRILKIDQIVPLLLIELMKDHPGLPGLFMAATFSAALSSMSGCLNALSAVLLTDFVLPVYSQKCGIMAEKYKVYLSRIFVFVYGMLATFLSYQAHFLGGSVMQMSWTLFSSTGGPMLGLVTLGVFFKCANHKGAGVGFLVGLILCIWIAFGAIYQGVKNPKLPTRVDGCSTNSTIGIHLQGPYLSTLSSKVTSGEPIFIYKITYFYYGVIGFFVTLTVGLLISLVTNTTKVLDPDLTFRCKEKVKEVELKDEMILEKSLVREDETAPMENLDGQLFDRNEKYNFQIIGSK